ncbi:zinc finger protein [Trichuris trichiura]|uniref:Zinc finger protein n=1 Tax=Trichuris trichiura TaxID=36087 RepID=A0A077YXB2_TRITR|nr:zinc finger protein [Trichuris trichiura]
MSERMAITAASRTELSVDHLAEEDCEDKLVIDVAPAVSGANQGRPLVGDLTESNLSAAAAASRFYSQYAVAQQQYAAALARAATGPYASALGCSYLMAGYPLAPPSTVATPAATSSSSMLLPKVYASPFTIMAAFPSTASAPNFKSDDKATCSAVDQTKQPLGATLSSSSSGGESWSGMSSLSASSSSEEGTIANSGASSSSVIRRSSNTAVNHKAVEEHITRLISENEALLEPSPVLLKRRSYTRQHYGSLDHSTGSTSSSTSSKRQSSTTVKSTRSQSLVDLGLLATFKQRNQDASKKSSEQSSADVDHCFHKCAYCKVGFRNMDSVRAHEVRCAHRSEMPACSSSNRSSLSPKSASATSEASLASTEASNLFLNRTVGQIDEQVAACTSRTERMYPYCNTVNVPRLVDLEPLRTSQAQALIAQTTFCTVRRRPVFHRRIFESGESVWTNWMPKVNPTGTRIVRNRRDSHLNILLMGCYRLRQKHSPLSYTIAAKQMGNLHVTHSAYWRLCKSRNSNPSAIRQQLAAAAGREQIKMDPGDDGRSVSCTTSDYCPIEQTQLTVLDASSSTGRVEGSKRSADMPKYIRGRGFGRYVCDRCGIRCKKPSMLKKHLRCHLDVRPYSCGQCSFSFKTKGNLTKHLKSKSHRKRCKRDQVGRIPDGEPSAESQSSVTTSFEDAVENDDFPEEAEEDLTGSIPSVLGSLDEASMPSDNAQRDIDRYIANSSSEAKPVCVTCGKQFTKFALLRLHMSVHCLEQSSRRYEIKCPECSSSFRSRSLLKKHLACAHPDLRSTLDELESQQQNRSGALLSADASDHPQEASVSQKPACNPRPFVCTDCDVAFRIHGHLAKHLRSKLHIMKLESVGKVPIGTFARIEEAGVHYFQEIDTRSGENSLRSLLGLMERFAQTDLPEEKSDDAINRMGEEDDLDDLNDSDELVIDVEGGCSPEESNNKSTISGNSTSAVVINDRAGELDSSKESFEADCSSQLDQADRSDVECAGDLNSLGNVIRLSGRSVVAGVWVPPTSDEFRDSFVFGKCQSSSDSIPVKRPTTNSTSNCVDLDATKRVNSLVAANGGNSLNVSEFAIEAKLENQSVSKNFCQWCDLTYPTWIELMVHRLSDHIIMKDGRDFRCPLANCDRVYPNRDCLRQHLLLHFLGRVKDCVADHAYEVPRSSNGYEFCSDEFSSPPSKIVRRFVYLNIRRHVVDLTFFLEALRVRCQNAPKHVEKRRLTVIRNAMALAIRQRAIRKLAT